MADANDFTSKYNTQLSLKDEAAFQNWAAQNGREKDLYDYDMRGAWKSGAQAATNGHLPDTFKKPNHPTFSTESQYSGKDGYVGGTWWQGTKPDSWVYTASPTNLKFHGANELSDYFKRVEPNSQLFLAPEMPQSAP